MIEQITGYKSTLTGMIFETEGEAIANDAKRAYDELLIIDEDTKSDVGDLREVDSLVDLWRDFYPKPSGVKEWSMVSADVGDQVVLSTGESASVCEHQTGHSTWLILSKYGCYDARGVLAGREYLNNSIVSINGFKLQHDTLLYAGKYK